MLSASGAPRVSGSKRAETIPMAAMQPIKSIGKASKVKVGKYKATFELSLIENLYLGCILVVPKYCQLCQQRSMHQELCF